MSVRECEVWGRGRTIGLRMIDLIRHGHSTHVCVRQRPFAQEHAGAHLCRCGVTYAKTETDND